MCNTTCNNPWHVDNACISPDAIPVNAQIYYVLDGDNECECCNCKKSTCEEPKKVSCRSLACQQLNDGCSCECKKSRKTTMVNVLENNVIRLEDKMNEGCADMHESIEEIVNNINVIYNALKDEEARAKLQEAFLHYGLDDAITRVWYNPEDRRMHFYHKNPANCLNVDVHEGCDCDCCNACGCECNCNNDECKSDIPYTMDEDCNIVPMSRDEEELFSIDCRDFIRDIFFDSARLEYDYPNAVDGNLGEGPWLVVSFRRKFETDLADDDENPTPVDDLWIDLSKIWKLQNYYDKQETRDEIRKIRITNTGTEVPLGDETTIAVLTYNNPIDGTPEQQPIKITIKDLINTNNKANFGETTTIAKIGDDEINIKLPRLELNNATLIYNQPVKYGNIDGTDVKITMPDDPLKRISDLSNTCSFGSSTNVAQYTLSDGTIKYITVKLPSDPAAGLQDQITNINQSIQNINTDVPVENLDVVVPLGSNTATAFARVKGQDIKIKIAAPKQADPVNVRADNPTLAYGQTHTIGAVGGTEFKVTMPQQPQAQQIDVQGGTTNLTFGGTHTIATVNGVAIAVKMPAEPQPGEGADGNDYVTSGTVTNNKLILTRNSGDTVPAIDLPTYNGDPFTGASQTNDTVTLTRDSNTNPFSFNVGSTVNVTYGGDTISIQQAIDNIVNRLVALEGLWKKNSDGLIPVEETRKVYGAGFYDTTVS